jgi:hypothetical protein
MNKYFITYFLYLLFLMTGIVVSQKINFIFPEFPYKETSKNVSKQNKKIKNKKKILHII